MSVRSTDKPISPLRRRMIEDMTIRNHRTFPVAGGEVRGSLMSQK